MIPCVSVENMRSSDALTIANLVPSLELMYRAALGIYKAVEWKGNTAIITGSGNNGGDGFALACILKEHGIDSTVYTVSSRLSGDSAYYAERAQDSGIMIKPYFKGCLEGFGIVVDCLLGTGFSGQVRDTYCTAIEEINCSGAYVVSADINSGLNGDTGEAEIAVKSDLTVTIGYVKKGLITPNGSRYMKELVCADIGIVLDREEYWLTDNDELVGSGIFKCPEWLNKNIIKVC